jgi:hydroxyacylglutathione hydrolase
MTFSVELLPILQTNYVFLLREEGTDGTVAVDPGDGEAVAARLDEEGRRLSAVLCTHHHADHIGGVPALAGRYGCKVYAFEGDIGRIPCVTDPVADGDVLTLFGEECRVMHIPGHTTGHVCYHFPASARLFSGDTLFAMGCGRLFEGTHAELYDSVRRIAALPGETEIYCTHEYTQDNGRFAAHVLPDNPDVASRNREVARLRKAGLPTVPTTAALERRTNPFVLCGSLEEFTRLRRMKDGF